MCGRYAMQMDRAEIERRLRIHNGTDAAVGPAQYNLPPGTLAPVVLPARDDPGVFTIESCFWGFVPSWKNDALRAPINARLDKRHSAFWRKAFARRRCLIPGNWWYEWQQQGNGKQPYAVRPAGCDGFFFAGIWSQPKALPADSKIGGQRTFAIVTTPADADIQTIHPRMPAALTDVGARAWLHEGRDLDALSQRLLDHMPPAYESWPVSTRVNSPKNQDETVAAVI